jgi:putative ABC transport system ATP-binding protein
MPFPPKATAVHPTALVLTNLVHAWPKSAPCLSIERLSIAQGERVFLHGPSGSGKSTLLALAAGVLTPTKGDIHLLDEPFSRLSGRQRDRQRADHIGLIFQLFNLLPWLSAEENIALACRFSPRRRASLLQSGRRLSDEVRRLGARLGLDEALLSQAAGTLSVGQQQRVAAVRALIGGPSLIMADEPTSALDAEHQALFLRLLQQECEASKAALIFVSHDLRLQDGFDRVVLLPEINRISGGKRP